MGKKVLIINEGNSENLGDQTINYVTQILFESYGIDCDWQSYSCHEAFNKGKAISSARPSAIKSFIANTVLGKTFLRKKWFKKNHHYFEKYKKTKYDLILIGGGQLLNNSWLYPYLFSKWAKVFKNQNLITFAIGLGSDFNYVDKRLIRKGLSVCSHLFVRDYFSMSYIRNKFQLESNYIPDPVFKISDFIEVNKVGSQAIVLPVSYEHVFLKYNQPICENQFLNIWIDKVNEYCSHYENVIVSITDVIQDRQIFEDLKKYFQTNSQIKFIVPKDMEDMISLIGSSEIVYSGRMHALIIGFSYNLKCEVYPVSNKLKTFESEFLSNSGRSINSIKAEIDECVFKIVNQ